MDRGRLVSVVLNAGAVGVAAFGTLYLSQTGHPGPVAASQAFGIVTAAFAFVALIAGGAGYLATHQPPAAGRIRPVTSPKPIRVP